MRKTDLESLIFAQEKANTSLPHMHLRNRYTSCHHCGKEDKLMETPNWCYQCNSWVMYHATCWFKRIDTTTAEVPHHEIP